MVNEYNFSEELEKIKNKIYISDEYIIFNDIKYIREK